MIAQRMTLNIDLQVFYYPVFNFTQARLNYRLIIHFSVLEDFPLPDKTVINA